MFRSKYIPEDKDISAAQYLAEFMCERIAHKDGKVLTTKFWNKPEWGKVFRAQITHANKWLKSYDARSILRALKTFRGKKIYSLGAKYLLEPLVKQAQIELDTAKEKGGDPVAVDNDAPLTRKQFKKKSLLDEL